MQHAQRRHHVLHLGHGKQSAEPHHLARDAPRLERPAQRHELRPLPAQHGDVGRAHARRPAVGPRRAVRRRPGGQREQRGCLRGHPLRLIGHGRQQRGAHPATACPGRLGDEQRHVRRLRPQLRLEPARRLKHIARVAEAGGQLLDRGRRAGSRGEVHGEPAEVARARAAPAVDRLARVADRGDRVPVAEQGAQQHELRVAGVLVLVEQHHLVATALGGAHLRVPVGDPRGQCHLIPVVEYLASALRLGVAVHKRQQLFPGPLCVDGTAHPREHPAGPPGRLRVEPLTGLHDVPRRPQVLRQVAGQLEHRRGHRLRRPGHVVHRPVIGGHDRRGELPGQRGRDQPHRRLEALTQRVIADQAARVGVIGADHRFAGPRARLVAFWVAGQSRPAQRVEPGADPVGKLGRRLPGEGEAEHPLRADQAVGHQPDKPRGHRLALARAGAGHDGQRPERRTDGGRLLRRRLGQPQQPRQLARRIRRHNLIPSRLTDIRISNY